MSFQENGLYITIFPPKGEEIAPTKTNKTVVNITNKTHEGGIRLEVSLDLPLELKTWCKNSSRNVTIGYQKSQEIEFLWDIPPQAIPGTYNYNLRIRFLRSTSFYAFQPKRRQLTILRTRIKPQISNIEPSFAITPASSSTKPITLSSGEILNLEIDVHNRSKNVDNYRISTDLDNSWYTIHYPEALQRVGAIDGNEALNLNPNQQGKVHLTINPPADIVAGNYKPEIALYSLNSPDLFLKKILYLNIPPQYLLEAELQTILNKVSYKKGQYKINLINRGNTFRAIDLRAYSSDEDECCEYYLKPASVRIPPNKTIEVELEVKPNSKQKRPFISTKQFNFQVDLIDPKEHPLPKTLPLKSSLFWRSRPLWQTVLLLLLAVGFIGGVGWFIWKKITAKKPTVELTLTPEKNKYYYDGDPIAVNCTIKNRETINKIIIFDQERVAKDINNTKCYVFKQELEQENCYLIDKFISPQNNTPDRSYGECVANNDKIISCSGVIFNHAQKVKDYTFKLKSFGINQAPQVITSETVSILQIPTLEVLEPLKVFPDKDLYRPRERIELKFEVSDIENNFVGEDKIFLIVNDQRRQAPIISKQNINQFCSKVHTNSYSCKISISDLRDGKHSLEIEFQHDPDAHGQIKKKLERHTIPKQIIVKTPIKLNYFTVDGSSNPAIEVEPDTLIRISWSVTGNNLEVSLGECGHGTFGSRGEKYITVPEKQTLACILTASDESGQKTQLGQIKVRAKEKPKPEPPIIIQDPFNLQN